MYELTFLVNSSISEEELTNLTKQIQDFILRYNGEIIKDFSRKKINLSYPIKKQRQATLVVVDFNLEKDKVETFNTFILDFKEILRRLLIVKHPVKLKPVRTRLTKPKTEIKPKIKVKMEELDKKLEEILEE